MSLPFAERPDDAKITDIWREATSAGEPCQLHALVEFTKLGQPLGQGRIVISPGNLQRWGVENHEDKFLALWNAVPTVSENVLDTVNAQLPKEAFVEAWR